MATVKTILNNRVLSLSLLLFLSFEVFSFLPKKGTCTGSKPCGTYPFCTAKIMCPDREKVCSRAECEPSIGDSFKVRTHGMLGIGLPIWWGPCINNIQKEYDLRGLVPGRCLADPFNTEWFIKGPVSKGTGKAWTRCTHYHSWTGKTRPCEPLCEKKKPCECGPEVCENESCPAKVDCPLGGQACSLDQCPGKTSTPGFNIGNLILGNLPKTANQSLPASTNVPLNQPGAVVKGALRVYVDSFDDFKVCGKQGQCYKVCYSDGTNCSHKK